MTKLEEENTVTVFSQIILRRIPFMLYRKQQQLMLEIIRSDNDILGITDFPVRLISLSHLCTNYRSSVWVEHESVCAHTSCQFVPAVHTLFLSLQGNLISVLQYLHHVVSCERWSMATRRAEGPGTSCWVDPEKQWAPPLISSRWTMCIRTQVTCGLILYWPLTFSIHTPLLWMTKSHLWKFGIKQHQQQNNRSNLFVLYYLFISWMIYISIIRTRAFYMCILVCCYCIYTHALRILAFCISTLPELQGKFSFPFLHIWAELFVLSPGVSHTGTDEIITSWLLR